MTSKTIKNQLSLKRLNITGGAAIINLEVSAWQR